MLFPREAYAAQQCSGVPFFAATAFRQASVVNTDALQNVAHRHSFGRSFHRAWRKLLALVARVRTNCLHVKARRAAADLVCRLRPDHKALWCTRRPVRYCLAQRRSRQIIQILFFLV